MAELTPKGLRRSLGPGLLIVALACLVHVNTVTTELVSDDAVLIPSQEAFHNPWDLEGIFGGLLWGDLLVGQTLYRPLTVWTLALNYRVNEWVGLDGANPIGYHLVNVGLHAGISWLVWVLLMDLGLTRRAALAAGLLFAAHPIHTEAVALLTNRATLLAAGLGLGFLLLHRRVPPVGALCLVLALFSKESALVLLVVCIWLDYWFKPGERQRPWMAYAGYVPAALVWLGTRATVVGDRRHLSFAIDNPLAEATVWDRICTALAVQFDYLKLQAYPVGLSSDYAYNAYPIVSSLMDPRAVALVVGVAAVCLVGWRLRGCHRILLGLPVAYGLTLLPTSNLFLVIGAVFAERWLYLPSAFALGWVAWGLGLAADRWRMPFWFVLCTMLLIFSGLSVDRNRTWRGQSAYLLAQLKSAPNSARANYRFGKHHHEAGRIDSAMAYFERALDILPTYPRAWSDLGSALQSKGRLDAAHQCYQNALKYHPGLATAHYGLGQVHSAQSEPDSAVAAYRRALAFKPDYPEACNNLATLLAGQGTVDEARSLWKRALNSRPDYDLARRNLEMLDQMLSRPDTPAR